MSAASLLQLHLEQALLLLCGVLVLRGTWAWVSRRNGSPHPEAWRRLALALTAAAVFSPIVWRSLPPAFEPALSRPGARADPAGPRPLTALRPPSPLPSYRVSLSSSGRTAAAWVLGVLALGIVTSGVRAAMRQRHLRRSLEELPLLRRLGRVSVCASDSATAPYAAHAGGRAWVVLPTDLVDDARALRVFVAHELQHHRQRDLRTLLLLAAVQAVFFWHPLVPGLGRLIAELQELACDEALLRRGRARPRAYAELLLRAASLDGRWRFVPQGVSAASGASAKLLRRRIVMLMNRSTRPGRSWSHVGAALACLGSLTLGTALAHSAVLERPLEAPDVEALAERLSKRGVSVAVDAVVVEEVNNWLGTAKSRAFLRDARQRLDAQHPMVAATFDRHHVPEALAAVAVVESGFRNSEQRAGFQGAGVWQFIPHTARQLGLKVEAGRDERLDVERETDVAARYLGMMYLQFQDWPLALAGYNEGAWKVVQASEEGGTRDTWQLIRAGRLNRYAATVAAAALILEDADRLLGPGQ